MKNPKSEIRNPKDLARERADLFWCAGFEVWFRISDFGFRV